MRSKTKLLSVLGVMVGLMVFCDAALGHHSRVKYDSEHPVTLTGTITKFEFANPHVQIHLDVKDSDSNVTKWTAEGPSPQQMIRRGWDKYSLKVGDVIKVTGAPVKDGSKIMDIDRMTAPNGRELD